MSRNYVENLRIKLTSRGLYGEFALSNNSSGNLVNIVKMLQEESREGALKTS